METNSQQKTLLVVLVGIGAAFMSSLDLFVVNVAFDDIGLDLGSGSPGGPSPADLSWILSAYAVTYAALLVPFGRLADRYGRKNLFVGGLALFVVASAACALSDGVWTLVSFRVLQAAGGAAMTPTSLSILMAALPPEKRLGGVRMWAATGAVAAAIGPSVGGVLTELSWHWVFLINIPIGAVLLWLGIRHVHEGAPDHDAATPDLAGALVFAGAVGLLALGLVKSPEWGWGDGRTIGALVGSVGLAVIFVWQSRHHTSPVIDPRLLRVRTFLWANLSMLIFNVAFASNLLIGILWMQQIWGWSAMTTGWAVAAGPVFVPITAALSHRLLPEISPARLVAVGSLLCAIGTSLVALSISTSENYWTGFVPGWAVSGIGVGLALPNLMGGATHDLPPTQSSTGSAIVTMARQIGFVIGISMLFAIVGELRGLEAADDFVLTWWIGAVVLLGAAVAARGMGPRLSPATVEVAA